MSRDNFYKLKHRLAEKRKLTQKNTRGAASAGANEDDSQQDDNDFGTSNGTKWNFFHEVLLIVYTITIVISYLFSRLLCRMAKNNQTCYLLIGSYSWCFTPLPQLLDCLSSTFLSLFNFRAMPNWYCDRLDKKQPNSEKG